MSFYDIYERLCREKGISPTQAGRDNSIAQGVVSMWKKRGSTPNAKTVQKLADYFGVSVDYLLGTEKRPAATIPAPGHLPADVQRAVDAMEQLNSEGQGRVADYAEDLEASGRYKKPNPLDMDQQKRA